MSGSTGQTTGVSGPSSIPQGKALSRPSSLKRGFSWQSVTESAIQFALFACALLSILTTVSIIFVLVSEAVYAMPPHRAFFQDVGLFEFFTETRWTPQYADEQRHFGIMPLLCGTFLVTGISALIGLPAGLMIAVYLSEYATPRTRAICKPVLEMLAGIPTVVYGYFALKFLTPCLIHPVFQQWLGIPVGSFNALSGGIVVGIMIVPMVASLSEDVLRAVPNSLRESGYALGSTKFDVSAKIVVPSALSGILAAFLLALSRSIGETMAVAIAAGQQPVVTLNPLSQVQTMTCFVVSVMQGDVVIGSTLEKSLYAVALVLFVITLTMNLISQLVLARYREVYQ